MARIVLLSGARKNAGDHFIVASTSKLFRDAGFDVIRWTAEQSRQSFTAQQLEVINASDCLVIPGGPCICNGVFDFYGLDLDAVRVPVVAWGVGLGDIEKDPDAYSLTLKDGIVDALKQMVIVTRDKVTQRELQSKGVTSTFVGCSTWFHNDVDEISFRSEEPATVVFSSGAPFIRWSRLNHHVLSYLLKRFPVSKIQCLFNHGIFGEDEDLILCCRQHGVEIVEVAGSFERMLSVCRNSDLHIGFRVHSHIASLIAGTKSILIKTDIRGKGMSEALQSPCDIEAPEIAKQIDGAIEKCLGHDYSVVVDTIQQQHKVAQQAIGEFHGSIVCPRQQF
ncbi:hypothetical protein LCGC14_0326400 [marine sediment metagenome]|uniref:Polysaccharide pyruvyl transferase domain-containing protein n=1 Tax=marine sediment metagenome TaxID=412755 RepID=A0A0F9WQ34_9ZZZZ